MAVHDTETATIASGASLSNAVNVSGEGAVPGNAAAIVGIIMPAAWDPAVLTLQGSIDGAAFANVYDRLGNEVTIQAAASRYISLFPADFAAFKQIKLRSGTSGAAVNQTAERAITVIRRAVD